MTSSQEIKRRDALGRALRSSPCFELDTLEGDARSLVPGDSVVASLEDVAAAVGRALRRVAAAVPAADRPGWAGVVWLDLLDRGGHGLIATVSSGAASSRLFPRSAPPDAQVKVVERAIRDVGGPRASVPLYVRGGPVWETDAGERIPLWVAPTEWLGDLYAWLERGMQHPPPVAIVADAEPWQSRWVRAIDAELASRIGPDAGCVLRW